MVEPINLSEKQQVFLDSCLKGDNVFLTGKAGTGKSFIVKEAIRILKEAGKNVVAIAPTGIAATNIDGQTIHSMFSLNPHGVLDYETCNYMRTEKVRLLKLIDTIFIDEISMLRPDITDAVHYTLIKNGCNGLNKIQIIFVGDLKQLEAPVDDNMRSVMLQTYGGIEFNHALIYPKLNVKTIELDEVLRQSDPDFIENLNIVRDGGKSLYFKQFVGKDKKGVVLAPHNSTVQTYNAAGLDAINSPVITYHAQVSGNVKAGDFNVETVIKLKEGCSVMYLANSKNNPLRNGTLGTFLLKNLEVFDDNGEPCGYEEQPFIKVGNVEYSVCQMDFTKKEYVLNDDKTGLELQTIGTITQYPLKLAYALSIHKSQGLTFDEVTIDLKLPCFSKGQMYVALSRVTSPAGLTIITR